MAHDVFISYAGEDKAVAFGVCATLEQHKIRCWIAPRDVVGRYPDAIESAIESSRIMVLIFSSSSNASSHVYNETEQAVSNGLAIIPFRIEDVLPEKGMKLLIGASHWLDAMTPPVEKHMEHLAETVRLILERLNGAEAEGAAGTRAKPAALEAAAASPRADSFDRARKRARYGFLISTGVIILLAVLLEGILPLFPGLVGRPDARTLIASHRWITYDPMQADPYRGIEPDTASIERELGWIRDAGFDGIITFTMRGTFGRIPELAKKKGLSVIAGVWDPKDRRELMQAVAKRRYIDAYCVGHNNLDRLYSFDELASAVNELKFRTRRPVSTTEKIGRYLTDDALLEIGDWVFPDAHVSVKPENDEAFLADAVRDGKKTIEMAKTIVARKERRGRPVLLKMVTYPMAGVSNASLEEQARFFVLILEGRRDAMSEMPHEVCVSVHSVFDTQWKTGWPFYAWDSCTGLLDEQGRPRPAVAEIVKRLP